jgi:hypothetical protein
MGYHSSLMDAQCYDGEELFDSLDISSHLLDLGYHLLQVLVRFHMDLVTIRRPIHRCAHGCGGRSDSSAIRKVRCSGGQSPITLGCPSVR